MTGVKRGFCAIGTAALLALPFGCSVVSGWSDLQGGAPPPSSSDDAGGTDATRDGGGPRDGASGADVQAPPPRPPGGIRCGTEACREGDVCCYNVTGTFRCTAEDECRDFVFECTTRGDCEDEDEVCCLSDTFQTSCRRTCPSVAIGRSPLCVPGEPDACDDGQTCTAKLELPGLFECR